MWEGIAMFTTCILVVFDYCMWCRRWSSGKVIEDEAYKRGYNDAEMLNIWAENDESKQKVNRYMQDAIVSQIENNGDYRRGDKKSIRECTTTAELENVVYGIIER